MRRYKKKSKINLLAIFLIIDVFTIFTIFKTSNATYTSTAVAKTEMEVALYAFRNDRIVETNDINGGLVDNKIDIELGNIKPGDKKYYRFNVFNYFEEDNKTYASETSIAYKLKIIPTTNLPLTYSLYLNESPLANNSKNILDNINIKTGTILTDGYGTTYKILPVDERCFKLDTNELKKDQYTLVIEFPEKYSNVQYQDLIESIKIQIESRQVLPNDLILEQNICR